MCFFFDGLGSVACDHLELINQKFESYVQSVDASIVMMRPTHITNRINADIHASSGIRIH
jgi:hypothetical protein